MHATPNPEMIEWLRAHQAQLLDAWVESLTQESEVTGAREHCRRFLDLLNRALESDPSADIDSSAWADMLDFLADLARERVTSGASHNDTATFILSAKYPIFTLVRADDTIQFNAPEALGWITRLIDRLGLACIDAYIRSREVIIERQKHELVELATPVVELWEGILAAPLIGTVDSNRAQTVMETLLQQIVDSSAAVAILDITGVPTVDTLVAQHLMKTVAATRLMGAECIISGIRPAIAQSIVQLGLDLSDIRTRATLADALRLAIQMVEATDAPVSGDGSAR